MADKFMTMEELRTMKVRELPNMVYAEVVHQLAIRFGKSLEKFLHIFNERKVYELEGYVDLYSIITVIS